MAFLGKLSVVQMAGFGELVGNREVRRSWVMKGVYVMLMSLDFIMRAMGSH